MIYEVLVAILCDEQHKRAKRIIRLYLSPDLADKFLMQIVKQGLPTQPFSQVPWQANYAIPRSHVGIMFQGEKEFKQLRVNIDDGAA